MKSRESQVVLPLVGVLLVVALWWAVSAQCR